MAKSPGHRDHPEHKVEEHDARGRVEVLVNGEVVADSAKVVTVEEDRHPARHYFPRDDVMMRRLSPSGTTTRCPFKGQARYFNLEAGGRQLEDAAWSYEDPYEEHLGLKGRLAFQDENFPELEVREKH